MKIAPNTKGKKLNSQNVWRLNLFSCFNVNTWVYTVQWQAIKAVERRGNNNFIWIKYVRCIYEIWRRLVYCWRRSFQMHNLLTLPSLPYFPRRYGNFTQGCAFYTLQILYRILNHIYLYWNLNMILYCKWCSETCSIYDIINFTSNKIHLDRSTKEKSSGAINSPSNNKDKSNIEASQAEEATTIEIKRTS